MRERDDDDLGLRDWAVPPAPADLVERVMARVEARADTSVGAPPRMVPVETVPAGGRRFTIGAVIAAGVLGAAAAAAAVAVVYEGGSGEDAGQTVRRDDPAPAPVAPEVGDRPDYTVPKQEAPPPPSEPRRFAGPAERRAAWERLIAARALREAGVGGAAGGGTAGGGTTQMDPEEIRTSVREVAPLLAECFEMASEAVQKAGGTATMKLVVGSEPEVGTLIEDVSFLEGTPDMLADADFTECMVETLMSVEMPPLDAGGQLVIHYPFTFSMDEEPDVVDQAASAARAGEYGTALRLAEQAIAMEPHNQSALTTAAIAACNLKAAEKAKRYLAKLSGQRQGMVRQVCLRNGVSID